MRIANFPLIRISHTITVLLLASFAMLRADEKNVGLSVELLKSEFQVCEEVTLYVLVENQSADTLRLPELDEKDRSWIDISLYDSNGNRLKYSGIIPNRVGPKELKRAVPPNDTTVFAISLINGYGSGGWRQRYPSHFPPGSYSVKAQFKQQKRSNNISFRIVELNDDADKLIAESWDLLRSEAGEPEKIALLEAAVDSNPDCVVTSRVCLWLLHRLAKDPRLEESKSHYWRFYVAHYPESYAFVSGLKWLAERSTDEDVVKSLRQCREGKRNEIVDLLLRKTLSEMGRADLFEKVMMQ